MIMQVVITVLTPRNIGLLKVNSRNTRTRCETKMPERHLNDIVVVSLLLAFNILTSISCILIVEFEQVSVCRDGNIETHDGLKSYARQSCIIK